MLRCRSYFASGDAPTIARTLLSSLKQSPPSFVLWLADTPQPGLLAKELAGVAPAVVGGVSRSGRARTLPPARAPHERVEALGAL